MKLVPVESDPFAAKLVPVEHDPFAPVPRFHMTNAPEGSAGEMDFTPQPTPEIGPLSAPLVEPLRRNVGALPSMAAETSGMADVTPSVEGSQPHDLTPGIGRKMATAFRRGYRTATVPGVIQSRIERGDLAAEVFAGAARAADEADAAGSRFGLERFGDGRVSPYAGVPVPKLRSMAMKTGAEESRRRGEYARAEARRQAEEAGTRPSGALENVATFLAEIGAQGLDPTNYLIPGRAAVPAAKTALGRVGQRFGEGVRVNVPVAAGVEPTLQAEAIRQGRQTDIDPLQAAVNVGASGVLGGVVTAAPEAARALRGATVPAKPSVTLRPVEHDPFADYTAHTVRNVEGREVPPVRGEPGPPYAPHAPEPPPVAPTRAEPAPMPPEPAPRTAIEDVPPELPPELGEPAGPRAWWEAESDPGRLGAYERVPKEPIRLTQMLINAGGINDKDPAFRGEIAAIIGSRGKTRPGLINRNGISLDEATLRAWELGYLPDHHERPDTDALLRALDDDFNGRVRRYGGEANDMVAARDDAIRFNRMVDEAADRFGLNPQKMSRAAFFRALDDIASQERRLAEAATLEPVFGSRRPPPRDGTGAIDTTPQGPQRVLPGAERITDRELIERLTQGRKRATALQKPADEGLFDTGARRQGDLLDPPASKRDKLPSARPSTQAMQPGARYVDFVNDAAFPRVERRTKPITRQEVLAEFIKDLGIRVYEGRVTGKARLGFYRPFREEVRIRRAGDIEVTAHEIAHLLDDRLAEIKQTYRQPPYREEMSAVSYDKKKLHEGFAEFVRLWMTQPEAAARNAPQFTRWFDEFVRRDATYGPALLKARDRMQTWYAQDALDRARSKIGPTKQINEMLDGITDRFRQAVLDDLHGIARMERELSGDLKPEGPYETARLTRAAYSMVDGAIRYGVPTVMPDGSHRFVGKGLRDILSPVAKDLDDWTLYAVGRSAGELMMQGRERLFTPAEITAMRELETPAFRRAFDEYQVWNRGIVDFAQKKGLISPNDRRLWNRMQYLPFHRVDQGPVQKRKGGVEGNWSGIQKLTGGTANIKAVLENMLNNAATLMAEALRNEARLKVAKLADTVRGGAKFMTPIPKDSARVAISKDQIETFISDMLGVDLRSGQMTLGARPADIEAATKIADALAQEPNFINFWIHGLAPREGNVVAVMRSGKPDFYEVADPLLFRALQSLNRPAQNWITRLLAVPKRIGQATITLTPDFMAANIARDTLLGSIMSRSGFRPFLDSAKGFKSRLVADETYREFIANGGGLSSQLVDETGLRTNLERFYSQRGIDYRTVLDTPAKLLAGIERIADAFEMSTRLGEYRRARAKGVSPRAAAYRAREVSTDFAMRGDNSAVGFAYDTIIFLKAAMNGMDRLYRGMTKDPNKGAIAIKSGLLAMLSMALYGMNRGVPEYERLEDWDKDTNWHFFIPNDDGTNTHLRYPKIWEVGAMASIAERTLAQMLDSADGKGDAGDYTRQIMTIVGNLFNFEYVPQAVAPLYEMAINRDRFTNRPIEPLGLQSLAPWARATPYTSDTARAIGEQTRDLPRALQLSPAQLEHVLRGYFNTWAMYGLMLTDAAAFDEKPDLRLDQYPVLRRFYSQDYGRRTKYETEFYDILRAATEARRTMRQMDRTGRPDIATELEHTPENLRFNQLNRADQQIDAINREIRQIFNRRDMDGAEKRRRMDDLREEKNRLYEGVVTEMRP